VNIATVKSCEKQGIFASVSLCKFLVPKHYGKMMENRGKYPLFTNLVRPVVLEEVLHFLSCLKILSDMGSLVHILLAAPYFENGG
jgi:hypothetical protein